jgi:LysM repeat protein
MEPRTRRELARYGAPAAFLAAVTIAVLLVKSGLDSGGPTKTQTSRGQPARTTTAAPRTTTRLVLTNVSTTSATSTTTTSATTSTTPGAEYYVIQSGDTLGLIAQKYGTTTDALATLNPGVDPTALRVGQKLRVR